MSVMGKTEKSTSQERSPFHQINDAQLLKVLKCSGFYTVFNPDSLTFSSSGYQKRNIPYTEAKAAVKQGTIEGLDGEKYQVLFLRDFDNAGVSIVSNGKVITKINYRDRRFDGTPGASPPKMLQIIGHIAEDKIPSRSRQIGATSWYYSGQTDAVAPGRKSVEFSITSSNPLYKIVDSLRQKKDKLSGNHEALAAFIDNPFAYIPFTKPEKENVDKWWTLWWYVVQRGLRDKKIPYPGQTSQSGFTGFFDHVLHASKELLAPLGYSHLSGVPTWGYVWNLNLKNGFQPDNIDQHTEAIDFFEKISSIKLPDGRRLDDVHFKSGLHSWFAVAPFMLQVAPHYEPELKIDHKYVNGDFMALFNSMQKQLINEKDEVYTYPLAPGRNLWHSLQLK